MDAVKEIWAVLEREGPAASTEAFLACCHDDAEVRAYVAEERTLRGATEIREFAASHAAAGDSVHITPWSFEELGQDVVVTGSLRLQRADGSIADAQLRWCYTFRGDRIAQAEFAPLGPRLAR
jgi:ketosteroid isomerase-like protein